MAAGLIQDKAGGQPFIKSGISELVSVTIVHADQQKAIAKAVNTKESTAKT